MPYVRYKMMSCVRKYLPVYFIYIVFASAFHLHYHLLGWLRASAQWGARYSKGMAKKETLVSVSRNLHPSMKHPRERRKLCTCLCHMVSCIFFCIQAFSTHMQNYCREEGRYWLNSLAIFIKKINSYSLPIVWFVNTPERHYICVSRVKNDIPHWYPCI